MNKKAIFTVVTLGLSLISGQALNEVIFEDKDFSKDGWSDFRDISNGAGWEVRDLLGQLGGRGRRGWQPLPSNHTTKSSRR